MKKCEGFLRLDSTSTSRAWRLACINATSAKDSAATSATWPSRFKSICNSYRKSSGLGDILMVGRIARNK